MEPADIPQCVELIARDPVLGPRYGPIIEYLPEVWSNHLQREENMTQVFFADEASNATICWCGMSAVVDDEFLGSMKTAPHFWIGPEMTRRIIAGESPILSEKELREANSNGGMNLLCWDNCIRAGHEANSELHRAGMSAFVEIHRGYRWKEIIANQPESPERLAFLLETGAFVWDANAGGYRSTLTEDPTDFIKRPHILGTTPEAERTLQRAWGGRWAGALFDYRAPKLGLNRSEQRLLKCAIGGETDECIAEKLDISLPTVKKLWVSAYRRVQDNLPQLLCGSLRPPEVAARGRGPEKRRRLLLYLRDNPEELRPYSRKLLVTASEPVSHGVISNR
jgi:DNA-binding CsgD family transcriptional regulator